MTTLVNTFFLLALTGVCSVKPLGELGTEDKGSRELMNNQLIELEKIALSVGSEMTFKEFVASQSDEINPSEVLKLYEDYQKHFVAQTIVSHGDYITRSMTINGNQKGVDTNVARCLPNEDCSDGDGMTIQECAEWCDSHAECKSFTQGKNQCYLKDKTVTASEEGMTAAWTENYRTHYIPAGESLPDSAFIAMELVADQGPNLRNEQFKPDTTISECAALCKDDDACISFTEGKKGCYLKGKMLSLTEPKATQKWTKAFRSYMKK